MRDPQTLGPYRVEAMLGRGGMGAVYRGRHERLGAVRAVKLLTGRMTPQRVERFAREAQALARLNHPSVVAIHDVGQTPTGELYYAMDLIEGQPLDEALEGQALALPEALALAVAIARAVDVIHGAGLVHRDLKPGNVMIRPDGTPVVLDLGLAFALDSDSRLTKTGALLGTPLYMAPEQGGSARPTPAADVFALGLLALELTTGVAIAELETLPAFVPPPPASQLNSALPVALDAVIARATQRRVEERYSRAGEFADALEAVGTQGYSRRARRGLLGVLTLVCVALGSGLAAHFLTAPQAGAGTPQPGASASVSAEPAELPDLTARADRVMGALRRIPKARDRLARALAWLERYPRGIGRERVLAAAKTASLEFEQLYLPGGPRAPRHVTAAFATNRDVIGIWDHTRLGRWTIDTSDPLRPRAVQTSVEVLPAGVLKGQLVSDPARGAVIRHGAGGIDWLSPDGDAGALPPPIELAAARPTHLALAPSGDRVAVARGQEVFSIPLGTGVPVQICPAGLGQPRRVAFGPEGRRLTVAWEGLKERKIGRVSTDYWVDVYDLETKERLDQWVLVSQPNSLIHFRDSTYLTGNSDGQLALLETGQVGIQVPFVRPGLGKHRPLAHASRIVWVERPQSASLDLLLSGAQARDKSKTSDFAVWQTEGSFVRSGHIDGILVQLSISPDGSWFVTSTTSGFGLVRLR